MSTNIKDNAIRNLMWKMFERTGVQAFIFIVQIVLARILSPTDIGILALVNVFIEIAIAFTQYGFKTALVRKKDLSELDISSVLYISIIAGVVIYSVLFLGAPVIETCLGIDELALILRVLSINIITGSIIAVLNAILENGLKFKKQFFCSMIAVIPSGIIAVVIAFLGFGIWAMVIQQVIYNFIYLCTLEYAIKFKPVRQCSFYSVKVMFSFGWKMLVIKLMDTIFAEVRTLILGTMYSPASLAYYDKGKQFPSMIIKNINTSLYSVMLPVLSRNQDDEKILKSMVRKSIQLSTYTITPFLFGLAVTGRQIIPLLLTDKWNASVIYLQIFCVAYALWPIDTTNQQLVTALGRSDMLLVLEFLKKFSDIICLIVTLSQGPLVIALGALGAGILATLIYMYPNYKLISYSYLEQARDVLPNFLLSGLMCLSVYAISFIKANNLILLFSQVITGIIIYISLSVVLHNQSFLYIKEYILLKVESNRR